MKISKSRLALLLALSCAMGIFFGYKMGIKIRNGDHRVLYPKAGEFSPTSVDTVDTER